MQGKTWEHESSTFLICFLFLCEEIQGSIFAKTWEQIDLGRYIDSCCVVIQISLIIIIISLLYFIIFVYIFTANICLLEIQLSSVSINRESFSRNRYNTDIRTSIGTNKWQIQGQDIRTY